VSPRVSGWGWYWLAWFILGFGGPEAYWLAVNARNTLSDQFWGIEKISLANPFDFADWTWLHYTLASIFAAGLTWLFFHLIFGMWR
jgi:hypothetical protein